MHRVRMIQYSRLVEGFHVRENVVVLLIATNQSSTRSGLTVTRFVAEWYKLQPSPPPFALHSGEARQHNKQL